MNNKVNFLRGTSTEYATSTKDNDTFYYTTDDEKLYLGDKEITSDSVTIDNVLSNTSENPVQNKVINAALNNKADLSDIPTSLPANGGNADTLDGKHASDFMQNLGILNTGSLLDYVLTMTVSGSLFVTGNVTDTPISGLYYGVDVIRPSGGDYVITATRFNGGGVWTNRYNAGMAKWYGWANVADGGNADTLDGKHASDFSQIISFGDTPTDTKTAIGIQGKTTTYWCSAWTDYPTELKDGQGMIIAVNYKISSNGDTWCRQIYITPHNSKIYQRLINKTTVGEWIGIIDSSTVASSTSSGIVSTGEQHFGGRKFFDDSVFISNPDFLVGSTLPSADTTRLLIFASSDNSTDNASAWVQNIARAEGNNELFMALRSLTSKKTITALCAKIAADGSNYYTYVINPAQSTQVALRNISSGTAEKNTTNCPSGSWYGKHD